MRYAIYFTPPRDHPLTQAASGWLGRDAFTDLTLPHAEVSGLALGELACITAAPRRYGFHGTLKAPFYFAEGVSETELMRMAEKFTASVEPVTIPKTEIARLGGFFAVVPAVVNSGLNDLAARVVAVFDKARAPLTGKEFERRGHDRRRHLSFAIFRTGVTLMCSTNSGST